MRMIRNWWVPLAAVVFVLSAPVFASAYIYDWSGAGVQAITDPADSVGGLTGTDILNAYHAYDGTYHYFRMDLAAAPTSLNAGVTYGFYIDCAPGGAPAGPWDTTHPNVPAPGIDLVISSGTNIPIPNVPPGTPVTWMGYVSKQWFPGISESDNRFYQTFRVDQFQATEGGGTILEWRYDDSNGYVGSNFTWMAANVGPDGNYFNDVTAATSSVVPIPSAVWLLGSGIIGLVGLKRRQAKQRLSSSGPAEVQEIE